MNTKNRMHDVLKLLLMAGLLTVVSGCGDNRDINHRVLPVVMGLESKDGGYNVYLLVPKQEQERIKVYVITQTGDTINEILDKISTNMETQVDLLHLKVIVFEQTLAEQGLRDSVSSFMRARDVSPKTIVAISEDNLDGLFEKLKTSSTNSGMELYDFFEKHAGWTPEVAQTRTWQIFRSLYSYTRDVAVPIIKPGRTTSFESPGSAVLKNGRMVAKITTDETLLFNAFNEVGTQGKIEVLDHATVQIVADNMYHTSSVEGNKPILNSTIQLKVIVLETKGSTSVTVIKHELHEMLTKRFHQMFRKLQAQEADILGLGQFFRTQIPRDRLELWRTDYYPYMKLNLEVDVIIQNEGLLKLKK